MIGLPFAAARQRTAAEAGSLARVRPAGGLRFDLAVMALSSWFIGGIFLDGWAHNHIADLETFFTPWHAVLYSGYMVTAAFLAWSWLRHRAPGASWEQGLPVGYEVSLIGALIFAFGGVADMIWHLIFGIEASISALLSPTHLLLAAGATLMVTGPLRAAWARSLAPLGLLASLPLVLSLTFVLALCTFFTQFAHPFLYPFADSVYMANAGNADSSTYQALGLAGILLQGALLTGLVLLAMRRTALLPPGALTLLITLNALLMSVMQDEYRFVATAAVAGVGADLLLGVLRPSAQRVLALRVFAFVLPAELYLLYFITIALTARIGWVIHLWLGAVVMAGLAGLFLSYLLVPPPGAAPRPSTALPVERARLE